MKSKKIIALTLSVFTLITNCFAIDLYVDGRKLEPDVPPVVVNNSTLVPMRAIFEALKADIQWDGATETVTAKKDATTISIKLGSKTASVNGQAKTLDVPAQTINDRTMVPVRFVAEAMNGKVTWEEDTQTVYIATTDNYDGYRLAPTTIFTSGQTVTDLVGTFMYVDGVVSEYKNILGQTSCFIQTDNGILEIENLYSRRITTMPNEGEKVRMCFEYTGYSGLTDAPIGNFFELGDLSVDTSVKYTPAPQETPVVAEEPKAQPEKKPAEPAPSAPSTPSKPSAPEQPSTSNKIYVTKTGKRYHYDPNCNGGTYYESTLEEAKRRGLTPCNKCVN